MEKARVKECAHKEMRTLTSFDPEFVQLSLTFSPSLLLQSSASTTTSSPPKAMCVCATWSETDRLRHCMLLLEEARAAAVKVENFPPLHSFSLKQDTHR